MWNGKRWKWNRTQTLALPPAWFQLHIRAVTSTKQSMLLILCGSWQMKWIAWEYLRGPWRITQGHSAQRNHPLGSRITSGGWGNCCFSLIFNTGPQVVTYSVPCAQETEQYSAGLCYLKRISFALQRQSAEQSIMCTLCLTRPIGEILPEEKIRLWKKCIILLSHETEMTREWSLESHNFGKHFKDALAKELSQYFPLHSMSSWVLREKSEFNCIWQF